MATYYLWADYITVCNNITEINNTRIFKIDTTQDTTDGDSDISVQSSVDLDGFYSTAKMEVWAEIGYISGTNFITLDSDAYHYTETTTISHSQTYEKTNFTVTITDTKKFDIPPNTSFAVRVWSRTTMGGTVNLNTGPYHSLPCNQSYMFITISSWTWYINKIRHAHLYSTSPTYVNRTWAWISLDLGKWSLSWVGDGEGHTRFNATITYGEKLGVKVQTPQGTKQIAFYPVGGGASPLRMRINDVTRHIILTDPTKSPLRIKTTDGVKGILLLDD